MSIDERVRRHLEDSTASLRAPDHLDQILRQGRRRKVHNRSGTVLAAAAVLAGVVAVLGAIQPNGNAPVATTPPPTTAVPSPQTSAPATTVPAIDSALGVVVAGPEGIDILASDGTTRLHLTSADPYGAIANAYPDGRGGLVYQHTTTPLPWEPQSILRLEAGAKTPAVVTAPPEGGGLVTVGTGLTDEGAILYYLQESPGEKQREVRLFASNLDAGTTVEVASTSGVDVTAGGGVAALVDRSDLECTTVTFVGLDGEPIDSPISEECLTVASGVAVGGDGQTAALLEGGRLLVKRISSGEVMLEREIPGAYMVTGGFGGWTIRTEEETILIGADGSEQTLPAVESGSVVPYGVEFDLSESARLGPEGTEIERPCRPIEGDLVPQDLPAAVAETRSQLYEHSSDCDYAGLATMASKDDTHLGFGGGTDPEEQWVAEGRAGKEALSILARLLQMKPAFERATSRWVWPAAFVDPSDEASWQEVEQIHDPETLQMMQDGGSYMGYRVGIGADGRWMFYVAGD